VHSLGELAMQSDKGIVLASALADSLRSKGVLLPTVDVMERICAEAITRANKRIYAALSDPLTRVSTANAWMSCCYPIRRAARSPS
jgi:hypothetical protein